MTDPARPPHRRLRRMAVVMVLGVVAAAVWALRTDPVSAGNDTWPPVPEKGGVGR